MINPAAERQFVATEHAGIERCLLRNNDSGGRTSFVRLKAGAQVPRHLHMGTEEVIVIAGVVDIGGVVMKEGDFLFTEAGEEHDLTALEDAIIFVSSQKQTQVVEA